MPLDDHDWTRNVERFAAELASVQAELNAAELDSKRAAGLLAAAAPLFDEVLRAIQREPHDQDLRLRAGALVESVLAVPVALVARQAEIASMTSAADALRTLASGPDQSVIADTRNFDDASDRIFDIAAGDFLVASTALGPSPAVAAALRGELPPRAAYGDGPSIDATVALFCESLRSFLAGVARAVFDRVATDLAETVAEAAARVTRDPSHAAARYAVWRLLDDAALHAAAASRRADPWQLGRAVASFELSRRWVAPLVAVESFLAERAAPGAGDESATPGAPQAASAIGLGLVLWAARDHLSSRQLDWLPRVYEPPLI